MTVMAMMLAMFAILALLLHDTGKGVGARPHSEASAVFAQAVAAYAKDPALRNAHGAAGEARSREFSWDAINRTLAETYLRLVKARSVTDQRSTPAAVMRRANSP